MAKKKAKRKTSEQVAKLKFGKVLVDRCKKVGLPFEQVNAFTDVEALKQYLDGLSPQTNPDAKVKEGKTPEPPVQSDDLPDKIEFESKMEAGFTHSNREYFDRGTLQAKLRLMNRKYGAAKPVRIVTDAACEPVRDKNEKGQTARMFITKFTVYYK